MSRGRFGKVAVLLGGSSAEREISLMSGAGVLKALRSKGVDAHPFDPAERDLFELRREGFERCFIALHGRGGEDGTVQGALEVMEIPYTGSGVMASALCLDKLRTKLVWQASGIPTPRGEVITATTDWPALAQRLGLPMIIKPAHEGSSIGITKVLSVEKLEAAYALAAQHDTLVIAEEFIEAAALRVHGLAGAEVPFSHEAGLVSPLLQHACHSISPLVQRHLPSFFIIFKSTEFVIAPDITMTGMFARHQHASRWRADIVA